MTRRGPADQHGCQRGHRPLHGAGTVRGQAVTQAADLYALGCVLFETAHRRTAVPQRVAPTSCGSQAHARRSDAHHPHPQRDPRGARARLVDRLLAKDPAARPGRRRPYATTAASAGRAGRGPPAAADWGALDPTRPMRASAAPGPRPAGRSPPAESPRRSPLRRQAWTSSRVHRTLIGDYRSFTQGGTVIRDDRIEAYVEDDLDGKSQWPEPWLSLNPLFACGGTVAELVGRGVLHAECARIFRARKTEDAGPGRPPADAAPAPARGDRRRRGPGVATC